MQKNFKDVAHLYIGCKMKEIKTNDVFTLVGWDSSQELFHASDDENDWFNLDGFKPILRKLHSMTEDEFNLFKEYANNDAIVKVQLDDFSGLKTTIFKTATAQLYLLSKQFDLFDLIEKGMAISDNGDS